MTGLGPAEGLIIAGIVLLLFAPSLLAFWLGFVLGRKSGDTAEHAAPAAPATTPSAAPPTDSLDAPKPETAPSEDDDRD